MSGLWRDDPATPNQRGLFPESRKTRKTLTQAELTVEMLRAARTEGRALELPEIMAAGIAQHGARFNEIRARGFVVENELERSADGRVLSRYWLRYDPERDGERQ